MVTRCISVLVAILAGMVPSRGQEPTPRDVSAAIAKALPLLQMTTEQYPKERSCFSCHHQAMPALAFHLARNFGFDVKAEAIKSIAEHTHDDLESAFEEYKAGKGQPGGVERAGYALFTLREAGFLPNETTEAVAHYLLIADAKSDHWKSRSNRPPSEASDFNTSYVAIIGIDKYSTVEQKEKAIGRRETARKWLIETKPKDTEDRVFQLLALSELGDPHVAEFAKALLATQRPDGGWSQLDGGESDSYATGSALYALLKSKAVPANAPEVKNASAYLIRTQLDDGSWHVVSRSKAFQPYFESGFPHAKDQFISVAASAWATSALILTLNTP